ncbi:MAG: polysulfide reductase NrfD [Fibrobacteres bacterium]|nr:polysulfide reductase NrfD [Fibrobacterota bacterium]
MQGHERKGPVMETSASPAPVVLGQPTYAEIGEQIGSIPLTRRLLPGWVLAFLAASVLFMGLMSAVGWLLARGVGIWGIDIPVAWGFAIVNFVWWIGIGHAGTFISAILLLLRQPWRTSINRLSETMTLFAVSCAGLFPLLHLGRPWLFYYMLPYPNTMTLWPQFRSALVWDIFAVLTYLTISILFWYTGMLPDLASMRDHARNPLVKRIYAVLCLGWRGSALHWHRWESGYILMAGLSTPLVVSVHSTVSADFATAIVPGWHSTIFPPFFVAGAIYSGFAMVLTLLIPIRAYYRLHSLITERHLEAMAKMLLVTGWIVIFGYVAENFIAWYSGDPFEMSIFFKRATGWYRVSFAFMIFCNVISVQSLWSGSLRRNVLFLWALSLVINVGMWFERFVIVVTSLSQDYLPSSWAPYKPTFWDLLTFAGTFGLFLGGMALFLRVLPAISMSEMRELLDRQERGETA